MQKSTALRKTVRSYPTAVDRSGPKSAPTLSIAPMPAYYRRAPRPQTPGQYLRGVQVCNIAAIAPWACQEQRPLYFLDLQRKEQRKEQRAAMARVARQCANGASFPCCAVCACFTSGAAAGHVATASSPSAKQWTTADRLRPGQFLGRGSRKQATAECRRGKLVAVLSSSTADLATEARLMTKLSLWPHPHLLALLSAEYDALSRVQIIVPIAKYGSMLDLTDELDFVGRVPSGAHVALVLLQVAHAILHLNALGIDHADVAARNVLVFEFDCDQPMDTHVKLGDLGEARSGRASPDCIHTLAKELRVLTAQ